MQERPEVTVRDPRRAPAPGALGVVARPPRLRRTGALAAATTGLTLAVAVPLGQAVPGAVSLTERSAFEATVGAQVSSRSVLVSVDAELRNDGARSVTVGRAHVGDFRSVSLVELAPEGAEVVRLIRTVTCPADGAEPGLDPPAGGLRVQVLAAGGDRDLLLSPGPLPLGRLRTAAQRACGFPPVEDAVDLMVFAAGTDTGEAVVTLLLTNTSMRRVQLVGLRPATGLRLVTPLRLPRELPRTDLGRTPSPERLDVTVAPDCAGAPRSAGGTLSALPATPVEVLVAEVSADGSPSRHVGPLRASAGYLTLLRETYTDACS